MRISKIRYLLVAQTPVPCAECSLLILCQKDELLRSNVVQEYLQVTRAYEQPPDDDDDDFS